MIDYAGVADLLPGMSGIAAEYDDDRDGTEVFWRIPGYGRVYGSVQIDGVPLTDSEVFLGIFDDGFEPRHACTDADGNFEFVDVPFEAGLISVTGPSVSDPGCSNVYFLDPDGIPLLLQAWDHHDMVAELTWFSINFWEPEIELQYDLKRAMASQTAMVMIDGEPVPDMTSVRAFDPTQTALPPIPANYGEIFWAEEGRLAMAGTGPPFGDGVADLRYPEWLGELPAEILILVQYEAPNPGPVTLGQMISAESFFDRGDGFLVGPPLCFGIDGPECLIAFIKSMPDEEVADKLKNSLTSKVKNAAKSINKGNDKAASGQLNAFINHVEAQRGKKISESAAVLLIEFAENILAQIDGGRS
jgi:hypothetical protein